MKSLTKKQITTLRKIFWLPRGFYQSLIYIIILSWLVPHIVYSMFGVSIDLLIMLYLLITIFVEYYNFEK